MNRLATEPSPYLRQHADNPVDWFPWGNEAFDQARTRDVPILLSVGYSSCHWCHVMAHESFEDVATAQKMNEGFVAVKVDREERPDVDAIYMEAVQAISGRGGWPMTVFMTPDGRPFFAGTYFPPRDAHGSPGFRRVLEAITDAWTQRRSEIESQADELAEAVRRRASLSDGILPETQPAPGSIDWRTLSAELLQRAVTDISARHDSRFGGVGPAPKFPQTSLIELCLRYHRSTGDHASLQVALTSLRAMAAGGIYDHLGGGFARYSTDDTWTVPHFEKMLYDQAALVAVFLHAWQLTHDPNFFQVVEETIGYVLRDLATDGSAGLCAAEDADSEGVEGLFYTWTPEEIAQVLPAGLTKVAMEWYGVTDRGNFEGRSILRRPVSSTSKTTGEYTTGANLLRPADVEEARKLLFEARSLRVRPQRDDKVLTEWNAMFGSSLAQAAAASGRNDWAAQAEAIGDFLRAQMRRQDGRFLRSWQDGEAKLLAYAADYAWVVDFLTRLAELTGRSRWLDDASQTATSMLDLFFDEETGALWSTGADAEKILVRPVDLLDDATPSATSVAAQALLRLGELTGSQRFSETGERMLALLQPIASNHPLAVANAIGAMSLIGAGMTEIVITGDRPDLLRVVQERYEPEAVLAWGDRTGSPLWIGRGDGSNEKEEAANGAAYVCRNNICLLPVTTTDDFASQLDAQHDPGSTPSVASEGRVVE
ncbi:MAG: thioredoxin domain-containing protein [Acidimicrobiales bacterium]